MEMKIFLRDYGNRHIFKKTQLSPVRYRHAGDELFIVKIGKLSEVGFDTQFIKTSRYRRQVRKNSHRQVLGERSENAFPLRQKNAVRQIQIQKDFTFSEDTRVFGDLRQNCGNSLSVLLRFIKKQGDGRPESRPLRRIRPVFRHLCGGFIPFPSFIFLRKAFSGNRIRRLHFFQPLRCQLF